jgi:hypothetical protein
MVPTFVARPAATRTPVIEASPAAHEAARTQRAARVFGRNERLLDWGAVGVDDPADELAAGLQHELERLASGAGRRVRRRIAGRGGRDVVAPGAEACDEERPARLARRLAVARAPRVPQRGAHRGAGDAAALALAHAAADREPRLERHLAELRRAASREDFDVDPPRGVARCGDVEPQRAEWQRPECERAVCPRLGRHQLARERRQAALAENLDAHAAGERPALGVDDAADRVAAVGDSEPHRGLALRLDHGHGDPRGPPARARHRGVLAGRDAGHPELAARVRALQGGRAPGLVAFRSDRRPRDRSAAIVTDDARERRPRKQEELHARAGAHVAALGAGEAWRRHG